jgi:drug/metabolite transporter (DMT)-like permease
MTKSIPASARVDIGILLLLAYPVGGSLVSILLRYLLAHFDSLTVGFVRALSGGVFLLAIALLRWRHELLGVLRNRQQIGLIVATTALSIAPGWMVNEAMARLPAVVTGLLSTINLPMMSLMAALVYADERRVLRSRALWLAAPLLLIGTIGITLGHADAGGIVPERAPEEYGFGIALLLGSYVLNNIPHLFLKHIVSDAHPFSVSGIQAVMGGLSFFVLSLFFGQPASVIDAPASQVALLIASGCYGLLVGGALYLTVIKRFGLIVVNLVWLIAPVCVGLFGYFLLGEIPSPIQVLSGLPLLLGCGIFLFGRNAARQKHAA